MIQKLIALNLHYFQICSKKIQVVEVKLSPLHSEIIVDTSM
jgi:hypothetical protein